MGFEKIDNLISGTYFPYIFSFLSIILLTQAFNIIDGLNGLCIFNAFLILLSISYVSYINENIYLLNISVLILCSFLGVIFFNFPKPLIFIGDGGAYFTGFLLASLLIILPEKIKVSPFFCLALVIYPVYETLRSFFRRLIIKKGSFMHPDSLHFHSLVFKYFNNKKFFKQNWIVNSFSSVMSLLLPSLMTLWACFNYKDRNNLIFGILLFLFLYEILMYNLKKINLNIK